MKKPPTVAPERLFEGGGQTPDEVAIGALLSRLPRVAPDDLAVERVWRNVKDPRARARASSRARPLLWAAPALAAFAVVALFFALRRPPSQAVELQLVAGGVFSSRLAEAWEAGKQGQALSQSDRLRTDATGRALVRIDHVAAFLVDPTSDVDLEQLATGTVLSLSQGALTARVAKRKPGEPFVVRADPYTVKVVGTLFRVERSPGDPSAHVRVSVREGVVEVSDGRSVYRVAAGETWTSDATNTRGADATPDATRELLERSLAGRPVGELALAAASPPAEALAADAHEALAENSPPAPAIPTTTTTTTAIPTTTTTTTTTAIPTTTTIPTTPPTANTTTAPRSRATRPADDGADGAMARSEPQSPSVRPTTTPIVEPALPSAASTARDALVAPSETAALPPPAPPMAPAATPPPVPETPTPSSTPAAVPPPAPPKDDPFAKALSLDARGDVQGEARELSRAADVDPERADLALYKLGRLAQRRLNDPARALAAFSKYRERFPQGVLLPEVDFAILELDIQAGHKEAALEEGARFLARHPGSERVDEVHLLRGNLLRDRGRYAGAIADYAAVSAGARGDDALYSVAYCQRALGDRAATAATLRDYLARYPSGVHRADAQRALATENEIPKKD